MPSYLFNAVMPFLLSVFSALPLQKTADPDPLFDIFITANYFAPLGSYSDCKDLAPDIQDLFVNELKARYAQILNDSGGYSNIIKQLHGVSITCTANYAALTQLLVDDITIIIRNKYGGFGGCGIVADDPTVTIYGPY